MNKHNRRSIRLPGWDYRNQGAYFVTIVAAERLPVFGDIIDGRVGLSPYGSIVQEEWVNSAQIRREIELDGFVVMPNHVHGIVCIVETPGGGAARANPEERPSGRRDPKSLGSFVAGFKSAVTRRVNALRADTDRSVWQRNYYERVIRNERELQAIREYIANNPWNWSQDSENLDNMPL